MSLRHSPAPWTVEPSLVPSLPTSSFGTRSAASNDVRNLGLVVRCRSRPKVRFSEAISFGNSNTWLVFSRRLGPQRRLQAAISVDGVRDALTSLIAVAALVGCATSSSTVGQVVEVSPGTYKIGVAHVSESVFTGHESTYGAVDQAGQYCHARGQKLEIVPTKENGVVVFRCGEKIQVPDTATPVTQEPASAAPVQLKPR